jgi:exodeoxyribonuclease VII large subunit
MFASPATALNAYALVVERLHDSLVGAIDSQHARAHAALDRMALRLERCGPSQVRAGRLNALVRAEARLGAAMKLRLSTAAAMIESRRRELAAVSPLRVLDRGYSVTTDASGKLVRSEKDVRPGDVLETRLSDGRVVSRVVGPEAPKPAPKRAARTRDDDAGQTLF